VFPSSYHFWKCGWFSTSLVCFLDCAYHVSLCVLCRVSAITMRRQQKHMGGVCTPDLSTRAHTSTLSTEIQSWAIQSRTLPDSRHTLQKLYRSRDTPDTQFYELYVPPDGTHHRHQHKYLNISKLSIPPQDKLSLRALLSFLNGFITYNNFLSYVVVVFKSHCFSFLLLCS
jgi:hypothetical protein